jgi:acyl-coenzyme A thioesterase PaaI-like protein
MTSTFEPLNPKFAQSVAASFARQGLMRALGIELGRIEPGLCELRAAFRAEVSQQHGYFHARSSAPRSTAPAAMPRSA